ncbi:MFS transporter [Actinomadura rubrobrunea]|uniref:MFS transporter n=1 Tax=Actinomadura rubrobrunea TaxID=115335 RepID=A0A9W6PVJ3_9ACTN|nr:MFS transporter [Actinomadura rubrobrunea]GLW64432.1 MFS transporter [Actinomadura rubrobrunea]
MAGTAEHDRDRWPLVAAMGLVVFMATLDAGVVAVALPALERDFGVRTAATEWVVLGYLLPLVAVTLPAGRWLDRVGARAALVPLVGGFTAAGLAAGAAPGLGWLVAARVGQGAFAGALFALVPVVATRAVRPGRAARATSLVMTVGPLGAVSAPAVGGLIVQAWGWPWIFYVNGPLGVLVIAVALRQMPPDGPLRRPSRDLLAEAAVLTLAMGALLLGLSLAAGRGLGWLGLCAAAVPPLLLWTRMDASRPARALARMPGVTAPLLLVLMNAAAVASVEFLAPFYLQRVLGLSAAAAGTAILAFPAGMVLAGPVGGLLADRWGASRTVGLGVVVGALGTALMIPLGPGWTPADLAWRLAVAGAGTGLFAGPNFALLMRNAPDDAHGMAGAAQSLARQLGFSLGPALATTAWALSGYGLAGLRIGMGLATALGILAVLVHGRGGRPAHPVRRDTPPTSAAERARPRPSTDRVDEV